MRRKNRKKPTDERKPDTSINGFKAESLEQIKEQQAGKVTLRIDRQTIIHVDPENQTEEYRQRWIEKNRQRTNY